jgi:transcriptional regulator with XRE-family HTH domain
MENPEDGLIRRTVKRSIVDHTATGQKMRALRVDAKLKLATVAKSMGLTESYLSDLERGRRNWTSDRVRQFLQVLNPAPVEYLVLKR